MASIITGDIIGSRGIDNPKTWHKLLKQIFNNYGKSPKYWEIFRGDSFQLYLPSNDALYATLSIKAALRTIDSLDARMSIGMGEISFQAPKITESTGMAFINSGESFDKLKKTKRTIIFKSGLNDLDKEINMMLYLVDALIDGWTKASAITMHHVLATPGMSQIELAALLGISQPSVSSRLRVARSEQIMSLLDYFNNRMIHLGSKQ